MKFRDTVARNKNKVCDAVSSSDIVKLKKLLSKGGDPNEESKKHTYWRPIHYAVKDHGLPMIKLLAEHGADLTVQDDRGLTPLHHAAYKNLENIASFLLEAGSNVSDKTDTGSTPLHTAALAGSIQVAELLLMRGADINAYDYSNITPLYNAIGYEPRPSMVVWLLDHGADPNPPPVGNMTLVSLAKYINNEEIVTILCKYGGK